MKTIRSRLTYANVMSTIAVFLIIGGATAFAATHLGNSVGTKQLKKNAVTGAKVKDGSLTGADVAAGSLATANFADGSINSAKVLDNSLTGKDVADNSLTGKDVEDDSLTGADIQESTLGQVPDAAKLGGKPPTSFTSSSIYKKEFALEVGTKFGETFYIDEACNPGDVLIAGGPADVADKSSMVESFPTPGLTNSWRVRIRPEAEDKFVVVVLCAKQG
jgi:hypothetical protein